MSNDTGNSITLFRGDDGKVRISIRRNGVLTHINGWQIADDDRTPEQMQEMVTSLLRDAAIFAKIDLAQAVVAAMEAHVRRVVEAARVWRKSGTHDGAEAMRAILALIAEVDSYEAIIKEAGIG